MHIVSVKQMIELEEEANLGGLTYQTMMERAGKGLADIIHQRYFEGSGQVVLGLVGSGNNGGDTLVALMNLCKQGWVAHAYLVKTRDAHDPLIENFLKAGGEIQKVENDKNFSQLKRLVKKAEVILDGILGNGISLPLREDIPKLLRTVKTVKSQAKMVAVDCPSGVDCDKGDAAEECLEADLTVCMAAVKIGLLRMPAFKYVREIQVVDIGLPKSLKGWRSVDGDLLTQKEVASTLPTRNLDSHKGSFGTCMIIAGSVNYSGAVILASKGAYRIGAGLVRAAIPGAIYDTLAGQLPEATWLVLPYTDGIINRDAAPVIKKNLGHISALLIGPGLGLQEETKSFIEDLFSSSQDGSRKSKQFGFTQLPKNEAIEKKFLFPPIVFDADGLKLVKDMGAWWDKLPKNSVLTPHPGEMSELIGLPTSEIQSDRIEIARRFSRMWGQVIVLKGALTVIANPKGGYAVVPIATSALATAGTGDVLAGMITGLLAQGLDGFSAAKVAAWIHARAGLDAAEKLGNDASVMAGDVAEAIPDVLKTTTGIKN